VGREARGEVHGLVGFGGVQRRQCLAMALVGGVGGPLLGLRPGEHGDPLRPPRRNPCVRLSGADREVGARDAGPARQVAQRPHAQRRREGQHRDPVPQRERQTAFDPVRTAPATKALAARNARSPARPLLEAAITRGQSLFHRANLSESRNADPLT